jgi:succinoglycan biosynthesis protein ExoA
LEGLNSFFFRDEEMNELAIGLKRDHRPGQPTLRLAARTTTTQRPFISIIVPVRNEAAFLADTLHQLLEQRYDKDRFEVIVADGRSTDDTRTIVAALQTRCDNLRLLDNPRHWSSAGRNAAVRASQGDIVLLVDGHCDLGNPNYLHNLAEAFAESGADCVGRPQPLDVTGATSMQRAIAAARASRLGHHPSSHIYSDREGYVPPESVAIAYRRDVFDTVGLFDETFDACEDVEFNHRVARAGMTCWFTPRVQVHYYPRASLAGLFRQMVRYGRGRVRLLRKHPDTFSLPSFVPAAFVAGVGAGPLVSCWSSLLGLLYLGVLGVYAGALLLASLALTVRRRDVRLLPVLPLVFLAIHAGAGAGVWCELLLGPPRTPEGEAVSERVPLRRAA